ncbi:hypothetical protein TWF481_002579 [Arthrobotrys musiformis]|uniref:Uncharacterized protein n=1 Tax=Arthrobotrys musiformis TaxID=47236 RepID=A0AAV9VQK6_9PEZI
MPTLNKLPYASLAKGYGYPAHTASWTANSSEVISYFPTSDSTQRTDPQNLHLQMDHTSCTQNPTVPAIAGIVHNQNFPDSHSLNQHPIYISHQQPILYQQLAGQDMWVVQKLNELNIGVQNITETVRNIRRSTENIEGFTVRIPKVERDIQAVHSMQSNILQLRVTQEYLVLGVNSFVAILTNALRQLGWRPRTPNERAQFPSNVC